MTPMQMMMQAMYSGMSPMQYMQQAGMASPQMQQLAQIVRGKSPQQLMQVAENMARQRGTTVEALAQQLGLPYRR